MNGHSRVLAVAAALALALTAGATALAGEGLKTKSSTQQVDPPEYGSVTAKCKKGTKAVSGGFEAEAADPDAVTSPSFFGVDQSSRTGGRKWTSEAINLGDEDGDLTSYAYCRDQKLKTKSATIEVDEPSPGPANVGSVTAKCKRGTKVFSGGFDAERFDIEATDSPWFWIVQSMKQGKRKWVVSAANVGTAAGDLTAYAHCREGKALKTKQAEETLAASSVVGDPVSVEAKCKRNQRVVSGGFDADSDWENTGSWVQASRKLGKRSWEVTNQQANNSDAHDVITYAYCEKKGQG